MEVEKKINYRLVQQLRGSAPGVGAEGLDMLALLDY
jgi:hypothetical protein